MDRLLSCECGREIRISQSQAGQEIECACGRMVAIPTLRGLSELPVAAPESTANAPNNTRGTTRGANTKKNHWQGWRGISMAMTMAACLIASLACARFLLQWWGIPKGYTAASEIEAGEKMIDTYDPALLSSVWHTFGYMGMRTKNFPDFYLFALYAEERMRYAQYAGAIAAGFAVLGFVIWITTRRKNR
jgi:hypothetical protein